MIICNYPPVRLCELTQNEKGRRSVLKSMDLFVQGRPLVHVCGYWNTKISPFYMKYVKTNKAKKEKNTSTITINCNPNKADYL